MFNVIVRNDLGMPLGKLIAQGGHAAGAILLGAYDFKQERWKNQIPELASYQKQSIQIQLGSEVAMSGADVVIEDQGHTVFNVPTKTAAAFISPEQKQALGWQPNPFTPSTTDVRMVMVVNKAYRKSLPKPEQISQGIQVLALACLNALKQYAYSELEVKAYMKQWAQGSFAKIVLNAEASEFATLVDKVKAEGVVPLRYCDDNFLVLGPAPKDLLDQVTGHLKML